MKYSRTPLNPYLSVDGSGYGLLEVMGYEGQFWCLVYGLCMSVWVMRGMG